MLAGTELRKERRLSEVLTDSINILIAHWRPLAVIALPVVVANIAFSLVILAITQDLPTTEEISNDTAELSASELGRVLLYISLLVVVAVPILFVLQQLVSGGSIEYLDETDKGNSILPAEALDRAQDNLGPLIGASLRAGVIVLLMAITLVGIPFAINRFVRWIFLAQVIMIEGLRGQAVLARSSDLVAGRWRNTFGRLIVVALIVQIPVQFLQSALMEAAPGVVGTLLVGATGFIYVPFGIIGISLMFFDLKARKDEHDRIASPPESLT